MSTSQTMLLADEVPDEAAAQFWPTSAKTAVTITIFAFLVTRVDLARCALAIRSSLSLWLVAAFLCNASGLIISTYRWNVLLRALGITGRIWMLLKVYTIGFFMNACLPGVVGGDVVRCQLTGPAGGSRLRVAATIVAERVIGLAALVLMCLCALGLDSSRLATLPILTLVGGITAALVTGTTITLNRRLATGMMYRTRRSRVRRVARLFYRLHRTLRAFRRGPVLAVLSYSFFFYFACAVTLYLICMAFSVRISILEATTVLLFVCLLTLIPISIGGLGLQQAGDVYMFGLFGVSPEHALGISIVRHLINYAYVFMGGILFVGWKSAIHKGKPLKCRSTRRITY